MGEQKSAGVLVRRRSTEANSGDSAELELVSTQMLKQILSSNDVENRRAIGDAAKTPKDGVLARDPETGFFEIIDEDELQAIVDSGQDLPKLRRPSDVTAEPLHDYADDEHLSLVSAQALRQVIVDDEEQADEAESSDAEDGDFNPYCS
jgi:hypothetical protein